MIPTLRSRIVSRSSSRYLSSSTNSTRSSEPTPQSPSVPSSPIDVASLLSTPTWSVASLLDSGETPSGEPEITVTAKQLQHLLRLSALPPPRSAAEETSMLQTLSSQLRFVRDIQGVDTGGIAALASLHDETEVGKRKAQVDLKVLQEALGQEEIRGEVHKRLRRKRGTARREQGGEVWDVLGKAEDKVGRYFVVRTGRD